MTPRVRVVVRLAAIALASTLLVYAYFAYLLRFGIISGYLVEVGLFAFGIVGLRSARILRYLQTTTRLALIEIVLTSVLLIVVVIWVGTVCNPLAFCIGSGGGYSQGTWNSFLFLLGLNAVIAIGEETVSRGYFIGEIQRAWNTTPGKMAAAIASAAFFGLLHIPSLTLGNPSVSALSNELSFVVSSGLLYGLIYIVTDHNLALTIVLHFFWDAYAPILNIPFPTLLVSPIALIIVLPFIAIVLFRYFVARKRDNCSWLDVSAREVSHSSPPILRHASAPPLIH